MSDTLTPTQTNSLDATAQGLIWEDNQRHLHAPKGATTRQSLDSLIRRGLVQLNGAKRTRDPKTGRTLRAYTLTRAGRAARAA